MIMNLWAASAFRVLFICCCGWSMPEAWLLFFYLIPSKKNKLYNILCYASCKATNSLFCKAIFEIRHETRPLKYLQTLIIEFWGHRLSNLVSIRGTPLWFYPPDTKTAWRRNQNISLRKNISTDIWSAWQTRTPIIRAEHAKRYFYERNYCAKLLVIVFVQQQLVDICMSIIINFIQ